MRILGLDVSSKTGWAVLEDGQLMDKGLIRVEIVDFNVNDFPDKSPHYPFNLVTTANQMAAEIMSLISRVKPDYIVVENTVKGRNRHTQRLLEFIHKSMLDLFFAYDTAFSYMDPSAWRKILEMRLTKADKKNNQDVSKGKKRGRITKKHLSVRWANSEYDLALKIKDNDQADAICLCSAFYELKKSGAK